MESSRGTSSAVLAREGLEGFVKRLLGFPHLVRAHSLPDRGDNQPRHPNMPTPLLALTALATAILFAPLPAQSKLTTLFASNNGGSSGWGNFFDVKVKAPAGITITAFEVNSSNTVLHVPFTLDVYTCPTTYVGNDANAAVWTKVATGEGASGGRNLPTTVTFPRGFSLASGSHGVALYYQGTSMAYTDGNGGNQNYGNADLDLALGIARTALFGGTLFSPRVWNGSVIYNLNATAPSFVTYGLGCPGSNGTPALTAASASAPKLGSVFQLSLASLPGTPGVAYLLLGATRTSWGSITLPYHLSAIGAATCHLYTSLDAVLPAVNTGGTGLASVAIPNAAGLLGAPVYLQALLPDGSANPLGATLSNAGQALIGQ